MKLEKLSDDVALASISLFAGGGIGDIGVERGCKVPVISACELVPDRAGLIRHNFPDTEVFEGDIWELVDPIAEHAHETLKGLRPWLIVMSPPCQGMSSNGMGRISAAIKAGKRPKEDERNRLVLPGLSLIERLQPDWFVLENVRRMETTVIFNEEGEPENILELLVRRLTPLGYTLRSSVIDFRSIGVPHNRHRMITVGCRLPHIIETVPPGPSYSPEPSFLHPSPFLGGPDQRDFITLREAIGHMPPLDAKDNLVDPDDSVHQIPKWNDDQHFWMQHTPEGKSAFENSRCVECGLDGHGQGTVACDECGAALPRPQMTSPCWRCEVCSEWNGKNRHTCDCGADRPADYDLVERRREVRGFKTSYRRLRWDAPASTLTQNSGVISSDMKGHPEEHRVLSLREILMLSSLQSHPGVDYPWDAEDERYEFTSTSVEGELYHSGEFTPKLIRSVIGESIPPLAMATIIGRALELDGRVDLSERFIGLDPRSREERERVTQPDLF